jgi:signal transduction histidine kinase
MSSAKKAKIAFALALLLLSVSGIAAGIAIARLYRAETQVRHTYDVEVAIGDMEASLTEAGRTRVAYVDSGTSGTLENFDQSLTSVAAALARIRKLTSDNPAQQELCNLLEANANQRVTPSLASVDLRRLNKSDPQKQLQFTFEVAKAAFDTAAITRHMRQNEDRLLEQRSHLSELLLKTLPRILFVSFLVSGGMFWLHYHLLNRELRERRNAETQLRQLSLELMRVQDEEHRRFARELHDGLGQSLAAAKMMLESRPPRSAGETKIAEVSDLLGDVLSQTRTISHLFHPPFLDEIGFASAAQWLIEGYAQRMSVEVSADILRSDERLPRSLEFTLFRVLQEALNNIQRHTKTPKVEVSVRTEGDLVTLRVKDYGPGIPNKTLAALRSNHKQAGVGLTAMIERVKEQGGQLEVRSEETGTEIIVTIPLYAHTESQPAAL